MRRLEDRAVARRGVGVLGEVAELDVVPEAELPGRGLAAAGEGVDQRRLAGAVGADENDVLAALHPQRRVGEQRPARDLDPGVLHLQHEPAGALRLDEREPQVLRVAGVAADRVALDPLDLP